VPGAAPWRLARLRRTVVAELALGVAVLGVTAALVGATPARNDYAPPVDTSVAMPAALAQGLDARAGRVRVEVAPARPGGNVVDVYLLGPDGRLLRAAEVTGRLDSENGRVEALPVEISEAEPGHYVATTVSVPFPGRWSLRLDVRVSDFDEYPVTVPFEVR
jgi:copper transport protein